MKKENLRLFFSALLLTLILGCFYFYLNNTHHATIWEGMQISQSALTVEYCEKYLPEKLFHQTINTYSNLFYFFLGVVVIGSAINSKKKKEKNALQRFPALSFCIGLSLIYLCFGSSFFHASMTWMGQRIDMNATYSVCLSGLAIGLYHHQFNRFSKKSKPLFLLGLIVLVYLFFYLHLIIPGTILLPILIGCIIAITVLNYIRQPQHFVLSYALLSMLFVLAAFILRTLDVLKIVCNPTSIFQGHSLWHIFTGLSAFFLFWFYFTNTENKELLS